MMVLMRTTHHVLSRRPATTGETSGNTLFSENNTDVPGARLGSRDQRSYIKLTLR